LGRTQEGRFIKRIILTGFRGSGKTTVGKALSERLGADFLETDAMVENTAGMDIPDIFSRHGEPHFREIEREVIKKLPESECVVSTGGGAVLDDENAKNLRKNSYVVFLDVDTKTSYERISGSTRPALTGYNPEDEVKILIRERFPQYARTSDICVDASGTPDDICSEIIQRLSLDNSLDEENRKNHTGVIKEIFSDVIMPEGKKEELFSFAEQNPAGHICAIAGNPCIHSKSPLLYNELFRRYGICAHYTYLGKKTAKETADAFRKANLRGISVTIPFKEEIIPHIDRRGKHAKALGAVNTVANCCGYLLGCNTDWVGVLRPLEEAGINPKRAVILGAGGAARGAVYALLHTDAEIFILNRTEERAKALALENGCSYAAPADISSIQPDLIINATSLGMDGKSTPVADKSVLKPGTTVFDLVYTPKVTPLLKEAKDAGCHIIYGDEMFIHQAAEQFFRMFGIRITSSEIREILQ